MAHTQLPHLLLGLIKRLSQGLDNQEHHRYKMLIEAFYHYSDGHLCAQEHEEVFSQGSCVADDTMLLY